MKINERPVKVFYKQFGKRHVKGFKDMAGAERYLEQVASIIDENASIKVVVR